MQVLPVADSCRFAFKVLKDVVTGNKRAIALCQGFMGNTVLFDFHILLAGGKTANIKKSSGTGIIYFYIFPT